jgi:hypothetical protein
MRYLKKFNEGQSPSDIIDSIEGILVDLMDNNMVEITDKSWALEVSIKLPVDIVDTDNRRDFIYNEIDFESIKDKVLMLLDYMKNKGYKYRMSCKIKGSSTFFSVKRDTIIDLPVTEVKIIFDK